MAKRAGMYKHEKRRKELARKKKQEMKRLKRQKGEAEESQVTENPGAGGQNQSIKPAEPE